MSYKCQRCGAIHHYSDEMTFLDCNEEPVTPSESEAQNPDYISFTMCNDCYEELVAADERFTGESVVFGPGSER